MLLLSAEAPASDIDSDGTTPLHLAAQGGTCLCPSFQQVVWSNLYFSDHVKATSVS